jgi:molybdopterin-dependent oxidoreductase alpha subunit
MQGAKAKHNRLPHAVPLPWVGHAKARDYGRVLSALWQNRKDIPYALKILKHGVCDGCSFGPCGLRDDVLDNVHLCLPRLKLLKFNTMPAMDLSVLSDAGWLRRFKAQQLRSLGRLSHPMMRRKGERGFLRVSWDEALEVVCHSIRKTPPHELAFLAAPRQRTNEAYYVFQKLARVLGTNNIALCSRSDDNAGFSALRESLGYGASTCSLSDCIGTDLLVVVGDSLATSQPVTTQYMYYAKRAGARIILLKPMPEQGHASDDEPPPHREFGSDVVDESFRVPAGGDIAFINGVLKFLILAGRIDRSYVERYTTGFTELQTALEEQPWEILEQRSGVAREEMQRFAETYGRARTAVLLYSGDFAPSEIGVDSAKAMINLALARGMLGRENCGIMPLGDGSSVHGAADCGSEADRFPGGFAVNNETARRFSNLWHHPVPSNPGLKRPQMIAAAHQRAIKFFYAMGGDLLEATGDRSFAAEALAAIPVRVHQDIALTPSMLVDPGEAVILFPAQTRYEQRTGGTVTNAERRIRFTPEIPGHQVGEALAGWEIPVLIGRKAMSNGDRLLPFTHTQTIRDEMSRVMPIYQGIGKLTEEGDELQWGGPQLYRDGFTSMPDHRAAFTVLEPPSW